jgi:hypothetical protein
VIAALDFEPSLGRVRRARFVPRSALPVAAAAQVANGLHDALAGALGVDPRVTLGDPVALDAAAWRSLATHALAFVLPGRETDLVFVVPQRDARALVAAAFREEAAPHDASWTALEAGALERIIARCAPACGGLVGEPRGPVRAADPARLAPCVDYVDVRVATPVRATIGVGILRPLTARPPSVTLGPAALGMVGIDARVVLGRGVIAASRLLELRVGDVVRLTTKVAGAGELNLAGQGIALGTCGVVHGYAAFDVQSVRTRGDAP